MTARTAKPGEKLQAVLFDMDGTLLDSEKLWDVALQDTAVWLGGELSSSARQSMIGSNLNRTIGLLHSDLGVHADARATGHYLTARTAELFATSLIFKPGAKQLLDIVRDAAIPAALVTSTNRRLTERALDTLGRQYFAATVCGDEVRNPKPDPEPYLRAANLLSVDIKRCVAIEDSPTGIRAAEAAGCAVLAVPSEISVSPAPTTTVRASLEGLTLADLFGLLR